MEDVASKLHGAFSGLKQGSCVSKRLLPGNDKMHRGVMSAASRALPGANRSQLDGVAARQPPLCPSSPPTSAPFHIWA